MKRNGSITLRRQVYTSVSSPPLCVVPRLHKVLSFNAMRELLLVVDPEDGSATPLKCPLDPPAADPAGDGMFNNNRLFFGRSSVQLVDAFALCGCCILFREGESCLCCVHPGASDGEWCCTKLFVLGDGLVLQRIDVLFAQKLMLHCKDGSTWELTMTGTPVRAMSARGPFSLCFESVRRNA